MLKVETGIMAEDTESFPMLGSVYRVSGAKVNQMSKNLAKMKMNNSQTRVSQVNSNQSNNISSDSGPKACWYPQNPSPNVWGQPDVMYKIGKRGNVVSGGAECKSQQASLVYGMVGVSSGHPASWTDHDEVLAAFQICLGFG